MSTNESDAITAMHTTLISIQHVRRLLAHESNHLSREVYMEVDQHLASLEHGLSQAMAQYGAYQYTQAPHLYEDDEEEKIRGWRSLVAWANQQR
jgi:hypothetical protein